MKQYTDITVLLDRSGSMASIKTAMESAFDEFVLKHRAVPSTRITLVQFDNQNDQDIVYQNVPIGAAERLHLYPRGWTPLVDAFVKCIDATGNRLRNMDEADRPDQVLMVIITDGQENWSKQYKRTDVHKRVTTQRENYKWQFIYLGANQDAIAEAYSYGIPQIDSITYAPSYGGTTSSLGAMTANTVQYAQNTTRGMAVKSFTVDQRTAALSNDDVSMSKTVTETKDFNKHGKV